MWGVPGRIDIVITLLYTRDMTTIQIRIDEKTKREAQKVLANLGLNVSTACRIFLRHIVVHRKLPFPIEAQKPKRRSTHSQVY